MAKHLHHQAGGDPSQGPEGKMANPTPGPGSANDFPDGPDSAPLANDDQRGDDADDDADADE